MTEHELPVSNPSAQGVDPAGIAAFLDAVEAEPTIEPHSLMILRHGSVVAQGWWSPFSRNRVHLLYSLSKSFTSTAAGFAVAEGLVDLDRSVLSYFPELDSDVVDPRSRALLVRHVASMASGHTAEPSGGRLPRIPPIWSAVFCGWRQTASPARCSPTTSRIPLPLPRSCNV
jgi:CubicO group peptidase (beta-lactamase class C family)